MIGGLGSGGAGAGLGTVEGYGDRTVWRRRLAGLRRLDWMLVLAAATFSYLWAYAATDALVAADVMPRWADGTDPRPRRLAVTFAGVLGAFLVAGTTARLLSGRQLRRIDAMTEE